MKWIAGRQGTGYFKAKLFESRRLRFDVWVLKYPQGAQIPKHMDPVQAGWRHFRANLILQRAVGGLFSVTPVVGQKPYIYRGRRLVIFRPDITEHEVSEVILGTRYVLSIGWLRR